MKCTDCPYHWKGEKMTVTLVAITVVLAPGILHHVKLRILTRTKKSTKAIDALTRGLVATECTLFIKC